MKLGFFSDIHSNADALSALLSAETGVTLWFCLGDVVGYGDQSNEACQLLRDQNIPTIRGNHDAMVLGELTCSEIQAGRYRLATTKSELTEDNLAWLQQLPTGNELLTEDGNKIGLRHANALDLTTYLYKDTPNVEPYFLEGVDAMLIGHTHHAFIRETAKGLLVNCGSVGQPRSGRSGANYTTYSATDGWQQHTIGYSVEVTAKRMIENGVWAEFANRIVQPEKA